MRDLLSPFFRVEGRMSCGEEGNVNVVSPVMMITRKH